MIQLVFVTILSLVGVNGAVDPSSACFVQAPNLGQQKSSSISLSSLLMERTTLATTVFKSGKHFIALQYGIKKRYLSLNFYCILDNLVEIAGKIIPQSTLSR
jgi:hypothetical protein